MVYQIRYGTSFYRFLIYTFFITIKKKGIVIFTVAFSDVRNFNFYYLWFGFLFIFSDFFFSLLCITACAAVAVY